MFNVINSNNDTKLTKTTEHYRKASCFLMQHLKKHAKNSSKCINCKSKNERKAKLWLVVASGRSSA